MKRDIWAAITFLVTGLLFYLAQTAPPSETLLSDRGSTTEDSSKTGDCSSNAPADLTFESFVGRDS